MKEETDVDAVLIFDMGGVPISWNLADVSLVHARSVADRLNRTFQRNVQKNSGYFNAPNGIKASDFEVIVNGAGDVDINGLNTGKASVTVNGAGDIELSGVDCKEVILNINGAGDAKISGRADKGSATISGAGDIDASKLVCPDFRSTRRGVGSIKRPR